MEGGDERKLNDGPATANQLTGWGRGGKAEQNLLEIGPAANDILSCCTASPTNAVPAILRVLF